MTDIPGVSDEVFITAIEEAYRKHGNLEITELAEDGDTPNGDLFLITRLTDLDPFPCRRRLKDALGEAFETVSDETFNSTNPLGEIRLDIVDGEFPSGWFDTKKQAADLERSRRLLARLLRAYHDWEKAEKKYSFKRLAAEPLPAHNPARGKEA